MEWYRTGNKCFFFRKKDQGGFQFSLMTPTNIIERRIRDLTNVHKNDAEEADPQHEASQNKTDKIYD